MPPKKRWKRTNSKGSTSEPKIKPLFPEEELLTLALDALARRPHSIVELKRELLKYSEDETLVDSIVQRLTLRGYLNDKKIAESVVRSGLEQKLHGRFRIEQELTARGVGPKLIRMAMEEQFPSSEDADQLSRALEKKLKMLVLPLDTKRLSRLYNYLVRQGFSEDSVREELERRFGDEHNFVL